MLRALQCVRPARDATLHTGRDVHARGERVLALFAHGAVRAYALERHVELRNTREQRGAVRPDAALFQLRAEVEREYRVHVFQRAALYHGHGAAVPLLAELEHQSDVVARGVAGKVLCRAQKHGGVPVVPAGVHPAAGGGEGQTRALCDGERVEIRAERHGGPAFPALYVRDQSGVGFAVGQAQLVQTLGYVLARAVLLAGKLGHGVQVAADARHVAQKLRLFRCRIVVHF